MADVKLNYPAASDATITLASLATSADLLAGRESLAIDNTTNLYIDYLISGRITTGTTPTVSKQIQVWAVGSWDGTIWPVVFDGTNSARTIALANQKNAVCRLVAAMVNTATSNIAYPFGPVSIASVFGGVVPPKFSLFVTHDTVAALNADTALHQIRIQPVFETVT
jgi:hypothetical protein